jgi:hypothetical protein
LAEARERIAASQAELDSNQRARRDGQAALSGTGRAEALRIAAAAARSAVARRTDLVAREVAAVDAAVRAARGL